MVGFRLRSWFTWDTMGGSDTLHVDLESPLAPGRKQIQKRMGWESWEMRARKRRAAPPRSSRQVDTCGAGRLGRLPTSAGAGHPHGPPLRGSRGLAHLSAKETGRVRAQFHPQAGPSDGPGERVFVRECGTQAGHQPLGLAGWQPGAGIREDGECTGRRAEHEVPDGVGRWACSGWVEFLSLKVREEPGLALLESDVLRWPQSWAR